MDADLIGGRFRRKTLLGTGAMGQVWLATDERLHRAVAVKVINPDSVDSAMNERFAREARSAAAVQHVNVVRVFDFIEDEGQTLIVMEHVDGETLKDRLERGPMKQDVAVEIVAQVCDGLEAAHKLNLVHRDLKPANVILTHDGIAKVVDFGLAKRTDHGDATLTRTGIVLGTPQYMAPEQFMGDELDARTDVHAAGTLLYELLCGCPTFSGETLAQLMYSIVSVDVPMLRLTEHGVTPAVINVIAVALQKNAANRWESAAVMAQALRFAEFGEGTPLRRTPRATPIAVTDTGGARGARAGAGALRPMVAPSAPELSTSQALALAFRSAQPRRRIHLLAALSAVVVVIALSVRQYAARGASAQPTAASVTSAPAVAASTPPATATPDTPGAAIPGVTELRADSAAASDALRSAPMTPAEDARAVRDREGAARDLAEREVADRAVRAALSAEIIAKWRVFSASLGAQRLGDVDLLRASFVVRLDAAGNLTDISPELLSGVTAFDNMASEAIQNVNRIDVGSAKRASGWRFRVQMQGRTVRVLR